MKNLKLRLIVMNFLQFAVWGAYLTCMSNYLGAAGFDVSWFYIIQGLVSIFMPTIMGIVADRYIQPQRLLGICHLLAGAFMLSCWFMAMSTGYGPKGEILPIANKSLFILLYTLSVAFYMPTLALSNTTAFTILKDNGLDTVKNFPPIRVFGTIGFIATMWFVNCAVLKPTGEFYFTIERSAYSFQMTYMQFFVSGILSLILFAYCFTLPQCKLVKKEKKSLAESLGLNAFKLFKDKKMALFFIFSALLGMSLQVTNGYATPFLKSFEAIKEYANSFAANNATMLVSLSQIAEALCILLIPFCLKRFGIKKVMLIAMFAWVLRFGFFGLGNPGFPGVTLFILSCLVYGVAFDFFNVSGGLFVDKECDPSVRASAQGLFMLMTNGIGASIGTFFAGRIIEHNFCAWTPVETTAVIDGVQKNETVFYLLGEWQTPWLIFAGFALVVAVAFMFLFKYKHVREEEQSAPAPESAEV